MSFRTDQNSLYEYSDSQSLQNVETETETQMIDLEASPKEVINLVNTSTPSRNMIPLIDLTNEETKIIVIDDDQPEPKRIRKVDVSVETNVAISNIATNYNDSVLRALNNIERPFGSIDVDPPAAVLATDDPQNLDAVTANDPQIVGTVLIDGDVLGTVPRNVEVIIDAEILGTAPELTMSPVNILPSDPGFNPIICSVGDRSMLNGEAFLTHKDLMRLTSDPNVPSNAKFMNDSLIFFFDTFEFMKISKKYVDSIIFWFPFTYQVISSNPQHRLENFKLLLKGKSDKEIRNIFQTLIFCFDCYDINHISPITIYFLKSLLLADFLDCEVCYIIMLQVFNFNIIFLSGTYNNYNGFDLGLS